MASIPASGFGARGLGSGRSLRDWAMVDGTTGLALMWSQEMPDAARCLPTVLSLQSAACPACGSGKVSDSESF